MPSALAVPISALLLHPRPNALPLPSAQTVELKSALAGTIARALAVFCVDEVVVFDDQPAPSSSSSTTANGADGAAAAAADDGRYTGDTAPATFLRRLLAYLETPPFLRRALWRVHPDLRGAGALPSLDLPAHARHAAGAAYREGVARAATDAAAHGTGGQPEARPGQPSRKEKKRVKDAAAEAAATTVVDAGLPEPLRVPGAIPAGARVTLRLGDEPGVATAVAPAAPREAGGYYWGYSVRGAGRLSDVLTECPWAGGYDVVLGTSERGRPLEETLRAAEKGSRDDNVWQSYEHLLVCFGGLAGLEFAVDNDEVLRDKGVARAEDLFDYWVDLCPGQGSRTVRTEEAVWMGLMALRGVVRRRDDLG